MDKNYDRIDLLKKALDFRGEDADWLCDQLDCSIVDIYSELTSDPPGYSTIARISGVLGVPESYFWNGLRIEGGQLVPNE